MAENKTKRNNATISFTDKTQKEEIQAILREQRLQNLMPDDVKGKDGKMVLWAVRYLKHLANNGKMRVEVPMFEDDSQEKHQLLEENARLKRDLYLCQLAVKKAKIDAGLAPEMLRSVINDCYLSVAGYSHTFMNEEVSQKDKDDIEKLFLGWQKSDVNELKPI